MKKINATQLFVLLCGIFIAVTCAIHGISEISKGNTPTGGVQIGSVGAISLIQNYLYSGIVVVVLSAIMAAWCVMARNSRYFTAVFVLLGLSLFLTGGGVAFTLFYLLGIIASANMRAPAKWLVKFLSCKMGDRLAKAWPVIFITAFVFIVSGVLVWILAIPPGVVYKVSTPQYICWGLLLAGLAGIILALFAGIARDTRA